MSQEFFIQRPDVSPTIYGYILPDVPANNGYIKVGYTERPVEVRINEQTHVLGLKHRTVLIESAMRPDGSCITDKEVHAVLERKGFPMLNAGEDKNEWYKCTVSDIKAAINELRDGIFTDGNRSETFQMRPEQYNAVQKTKAYFTSCKKDDPLRSPKFLWNAKMRFGKTFASYQLAKAMNLKRVLVLTFKPAVESAWREDLLTHVDFDGWQFVSNKDAVAAKSNIDVEFERCDKNKPIVVFGSFQDLLGTNENGGIKAKNEFIHTTTWDLVIFDEYHFGAWRENAKKLFENQDEEALADFDVEAYKKNEADNAYNETFLPITTSYYLYLSGTPFRAINSGEFIEEQIFNWTYTDEQRAKEEWKGSDNPYLALPRMVMLTYKLPDDIKQIAEQGEFDGFDLNLFFAAKGKGADAQFVHKNEVQKWLDLIRGAYMPSTVDDLKLGQDKRPPMPFSDTRLLNVLSHTLWYLPNVASCVAMKNLLSERQNSFYHDYKINLCAGVAAGVGLEVLKPVKASMGDPLETKTITLSCGKLTTGVTVKPWTGVFMLRKLSSPESYFQTAFRVQSPWEIMDDTGHKQIIKKECYVFDFALDRALKQIADYSCQLNVGESNPEKKVGEFINFLPVLAYDGASMRQINAKDVLDIAYSGTSATLLARRWESALLVNVDNATLARILANEEALNALMGIEGFRTLNKDIPTIINKSEAVKKARKETEGKLSEAKKKELSEEEKEFKSLRKNIQDRLIKFAARIPIFMYLTDFREATLKDVITQLEPGLFVKVTGLKVKDFELLCSLGVFNASLMSQAVFNFKRYEDSSLSYTGIEKHHEDEIGGWDTAIKRKEYEKLFYNQQASMSSDTFAKATGLKIEVEPHKDIYRNIPQKPAEAEAPVPPKAMPLPSAKKQEPAPKAQVNLDGFGIGSHVSHKLFKDGIVIALDKTSGKLKVAFSEGFTKLFTYPGSIEDGFLKITK